MCPPSQMVDKEIASRKRQLDMSKNRTSAKASLAIRDILSRVGSGVEFEMSPPAGYFRLNVFGEIVKTSDFEPDNL